MLLDYQFKDPSLLKIALTHPSIKLPANKGKQNYQRMEFLGDKVLGMVIADLIYKRFPDMSEGNLSVVFANLVQTKILAHIAEEQNLADHLNMDNGEKRAGGAQNPKNLENALEAVIAAIYLDSDHRTVYNIIAQLWEGYLQDTSLIFKKDDKSSLQELAQKNFRLVPSYQVIDKQGADHDPYFTVQVKIDYVEPLICVGVGKSIKAAEYDAAKQMLDKLLLQNNNHEPK